MLLLSLLQPQSPRLVVADLDFCLWRRPRFQKPRFEPTDDGGLISECGKKLQLYPGARSALLRLSAADIDIAVVSRTHRKDWARQWLSLLKLDESRTVSDVICCSVMRDGAKSLHVIFACD